MDHSKWSAGTGAIVASDWDVVGEEQAPKGWDVMEEKPVASDPAKGSLFQDATDIGSNIVTGGLGSYAKALGSGVASAVKGNSFSDAYDKSLKENEVSKDAGQGSMLGTGMTLAGKAMKAVPFAPVRAIGSILSASPVLNAVSGATSEMARGADERAGGGWGEQLLASLLGGVGPGLAENAVTAGKNLISKSPEIIDSLSDKLAAKNIADVFKRDKLDINKVPQDQNILQSGDKGATARAESIVTRGDEGGDKILDYATGQRTNLPMDLSDALGRPFEESDYPKLLEGLKNKARAEAKPAYDAAYDAMPRVVSPEIDESLMRIKEAGDWPVLVSEARKLAAYEGKTLGNIGPEVDGIPKFSTKDLDYMTRALRNLGQGTEGMGGFGGKTPLGAMRSNTANAIRGELKEINPEFGKAVNQYADDISTHEAAQVGKGANLFGSDWKQAVADYNKLSSPVEKNAWRIGQAEKLHTSIASNPGAALARMNSPQFAKVMRNFYSQDEYLSLIDSIKQSAKEAKQINQITGNSRTAARALQQAGDAADVTNLPAEAINRGLTRTAIDWAKGKTIDKFFNSPVRQIADKKVANTLLSTPFNLAAQEAQGDLPAMMRNAIMGKSIMSPEEVAQARLNAFLGSGKTVPFADWMLFENSEKK